MQRAIASLDMTHVVLCAMATRKESIVRAVLACKSHLVEHAQDVDRLSVFCLGDAGASRMLNMLSAPPANTSAWDVNLRDFVFLELIAQHGAAREKDLAEIATRVASDVEEFIIALNQEFGNDSPIYPCLYAYDTLPVAQTLLDMKAGRTRPPWWAEVGSAQCWSA